MDFKDYTQRLIQIELEVAHFRQAKLNELLGELSAHVELFDAPQQQHVVGLTCDCGESVKVLHDYKGKGVDYYCCARPMATGCRFWKRADEYQVAGGYK